MALAATPRFGACCGFALWVEGDGAQGNKTFETVHGQGTRSVLSIIVFLAIARTVRTGHEGKEGPRAFRRSAVIVAFEALRPLPLSGWIPL